MTDRQTVVETDPFLAQAARAGMTERDRDALVEAVASDPGGGTALGSGLYKRRAARSGGGKSGGFRTIYYFGGRDVPIYLLAAFSKADRANVARAELDGLRALAKQLGTELRRQR